MEVAVTLSLLRVIDNPLQDIPFASVLMSPIYGFTVDDMAQMRGNEKGNSRYIWRVNLLANKISRRLHF